MSITKRLPFDTEIRAKGDEAEIIITTPTADYARDRVLPLGMNLDRYLAGPRAVNFAHDHSRLPVARTTALQRTGNGVLARFRWIQNDPDAALVRNSFEQGALGASVEFLVHRSAPNTHGGLDYVETTLTGYALTGNPANPECVALAKSLAAAAWQADDAVVLELLPDARRDGALPESQSATWPAAVVGARRQIHDYLAGFAEDDQPDPRLDPLREVEEILTDWLQSLDGGGERMVPLSQVEALVRAAVKPIEARFRTVLAEQQRPEPEFNVSQHDLGQIVSESLRALVPAMVQEQTRAAINRLKGRID